MGVSVGNGRSRLARLFLACLLLVCALQVVAVLPGRAVAQEPEGKKADPPAQEGQTAEKINPFSHMLESVGPGFGLILLTVSICLVTLIVLLAMDLRLEVAIPRAFVDEFTDIVNKRQLKQAFELCRNDSSF